MSRGMIHAAGSVLMISGGLGMAKVSPESIVYAWCIAMFTVGIAMVIASYQKKKG